MMRRNILTRDDVITNARLMGVPPALALAIWQQESSSGANAVTSPKGAVGGFQVMPATFNKVYPGGNIYDPVDNMIAGLRVLKECLDRAGGDQEKAAQCYYSGRILKPGETGPTSGPGTPTVRGYGRQVVAKASPGLVDTSQDFQYDISEQFASPEEDEEEDMYQWVPDEEEQYNTPVEPGWKTYLAGGGSDLTPYTGGFGGSEEAFNIGQRDYEFDRYIRQLVDEELKA